MTARKEERRPSKDSEFRDGWKQLPDIQHGGPHVRVVAARIQYQYPTRMADGIPFFGVLVISEAVKGENVEITWDHQSCRIWESRVQQLSTPIPILQNMRERFAGVWLLTERCGTVLLAQFGRVTTIACVLCQLLGEFVLGRGTPIRKEGGG